MFVGKDSRCLGMQGIVRIVRIAGCSVFVKKMGGRQRAECGF